MNARINDISAQAHTFAFDTHGHWEDNPQYDEAFEQKFAELIIQECIDQCDDNGSNDEWDRAVRWSANQIKKHFGVTV